MGLIKLKMQQTHGLEDRQPKRNVAYTRIARLIKQPAKKLRSTSANDEAFRNVQAHGTEQHNTVTASQSRGHSHQKTYHHEQAHRIVHGMDSKDEPRGQ